MKMRTIVIVIFFIFITILLSCNNKKQKKEFYDSGKLKTLATVINGRKLIDTFYTYFENGNVEAQIYYDSSGIQQGIAKLFYQNGVLKLETNYYNGKENGLSNFFDSTGLILGSKYYYMGKLIGDNYDFDSGRIARYKFFDFSGRLVNKIEYKNNSTIVSDIRQSAFSDSISFSHIKNDSTFLNMLILVSNPYKCSTDLRIFYFNHYNKVIREDSLDKKDCHLMQKKIGFLNNKLSFIKIVCNQYDSILKKHSTQTDSIALVND